MKSESEVQQLIQLEAPKHRAVLQRNNSGAGTFINEETGDTSHVRFGLNNLSKEQNKRIKSSDLIGWIQLQVLFQWRAIPQWVPVFLAIEVKKEGWVFKGDEREVAQKAYIDWVISQGGIAGFASSVDDFLRLIGKL